MVFSRVKQVTDSREADINYRFPNEKQPNNTKKAVCPAPTYCPCGSRTASGLILRVLSRRNLKRQADIDLRSRIRRRSDPNAIRPAVAQPDALLQIDNADMNRRIRKQIALQQLMNFLKLLPAHALPVIADNQPQLVLGAGNMNRQFQRMRAALHAVMNRVFHNGLKGEFGNLRVPAGFLHVNDANQLLFKTLLLNLQIALDQPQLLSERDDLLLPADAFPNHPGIHGNQGRRFPSRRFSARWPGWTAGS